MQTSEGSGRESIWKLLNELLQSRDNHQPLLHRPCNHALRKILLSETGSVAIRKNRSKGGSRNESKGPNADIQICNNSIITTANHSMLKCGCKANLLKEICKTNQHHHKPGCILCRSIEHYTNLNKHSFSALLMGIYMRDINFHNSPDWAQPSAPLGQVNIQLPVLSPGPVTQRLPLVQGEHQEEFLHWRGCHGLESPSLGCQQSPGHGSCTLADLEVWLTETETFRTELTFQSQNISFKVFLTAQIEFLTITLYAVAYFLYPSYLHITLYMHEPT